VDITDLVPQPAIGWVYENGVFSSPTSVVPTPDADLATVKARAIDSVNMAAGASRVKFITDIPGQESTYHFKKEEMERYFGTPTPSPDAFPFLAAEAQATNSTMAAVAAAVRETWSQWQPRAVAIEAARRGAVVEIQTAQTVEAVIAVQAQFP
jgi:hypothetical protein